MTAICSTCASVDGPFIKEPTGIPSSPYFYQCQRCSEENRYITFKDAVGITA
jgi:hypothetical protein